jgi:hypothetical protein
MAREKICPSCINDAIERNEELGDECLALRDTKNYAASLCDDHRDRRNGFFMELQKAINSTKEQYRQMVNCTCDEGNLSSQMACQEHGISAQLNRSQME